MNSMILSFVTFLAASSAWAATPPAEINRETHSRWISEINAPTSPYENYIYNWLEAQRTKPLPAAVQTDPDKLAVIVDDVLAEAVRVEANGDAEEGTSFGLESYGLVDAPVDMVLETILFRWGKPVGAQSGTTYPFDIVYGYREERLNPEWGPGSYRTVTTKKKGGFALPMNDVFSLLVRGNPTDGYVLAGDFIEPSGETTTTTSVTIIYIRPTADGKTDYRVSGLQTGQSYAHLGPIDKGRRNFGFNAKKIRDGQKDFLSQVASLKNTGKIPERKP